MFTFVVRSIFLELNKTNMPKWRHYSSKHICLNAVVSLTDLMDLVLRNCRMKDKKLRKGRVLVTQVNIVTYKR